MASSGKCGKCGSKRVKEVITGGMKQIVHWDGGYVVAEETTYEKTDRHSTYTCEDCGTPL